MKPETVVKIVGVVGMALSGAASLAMNWSNKKEMDATITKKVTEIVKEQIEKA